MKPARRILDRIAGGRLTTGVLVTEQLFPQMVDYFRTVGLDYMIVDREHGAFDDGLVADVCTLGRMTNFAVLLRPIDCEYPTIRRAIDRGPCGFLLPSVESAADLDRVRDAIYMPPRGRRRPGGLGNYWVRDYSAETWRAEVEEDFIVLPQIETVEGLENADEIAAHELTTAIAIGPYDLSHAIGVNARMDHPEFLRALARIEDDLRGFQRTLRKRGLERFALEFFVEARYQSQIWELDVPLPTRRLSGPAALATLSEAFHRMHERVFAVRDEGSRIEFVSWKGRLAAKLGQDPASAAEGAARPDKRPAPTSRSAFFASTGRTDVAVHRGLDLPPGAVMTGPAIIEEPTSTLVVYPGWAAELSSSGSYVARQQH